MKVIDLLNMIDKGELPPKEILVDGFYYIWDDIEYFYKREDEDKDLLYDISEYSLPEALNTIVNVRGDNKIQKLNLCEYEEFVKMSPMARYQVTADEYNVINKLVNEINKLKEGK